MILGQVDAMGQFLRNPGYDLISLDILWAKCLSHTCAALVSNLLLLFNKYNHFYVKYSVSDPAAKNGRQDIWNFDLG